MRIGLLSDIHGNLSALDAVVAALGRAGPLDAVVVAGDHLLGGPRPRAVWELLGQQGWTLVRGNEDDALVQERAPDLEPQHRFARAYVAQHAWTRARLGPEILAALAALPVQQRIATPAGSLLVVHSSPRSATDRAGGIHNTADEVDAAYNGFGATAIAFGHYHRSFVRPAPFALLINVASVGIPNDHQPLASFTVLHARSDGWLVEQLRVPYDADSERAAGIQEEMPPWIPD